MLKLENCTVRNGAFTLRADFEVKAGESVSVLGPSGSGKSTLLEAVAGFLPLAEGRILLNNADIGDSHPGKRSVAALFQDGNLFDHLTVLQNAGLGLRPDLRLSNEDRDRIHAALERVDLKGLGSRRPSELSGGQRSRAALARVVLQRRELLLLDEPFAALGPGMRAQMLDLVLELSREVGSTMLVVSHAMEDARRINGRSILVAEGMARAPESTERLLKNPPPALRDYIGPNFQNKTVT
ncbi:MAG: ATP-binding cassette domain-containing protein [Roseovarius sp.]|nr:ATP-binding cassette domain-containing protein [Roseovarius sp.]